jgi:hypothetical protein
VPQGRCHALKWLGDRNHQGRLCALHAARQCHHDEQQTSPAMQQVAQAGRLLGRGQQCLTPLRPLLSGHRRQLSARAATEVAAVSVKPQEGLCNTARNRRLSSASFANCRRGSRRSVSSLSLARRRLQAGP